MIDFGDRPILPEMEIKMVQERDGAGCAYYRGSRYTGLMSAYRKDGRLKGVYDYYEGYNDGIAWIYHEMGHLWMIQGWFWGQEHGRWRFYDKHGFLYRLQVNYMRHTLYEEHYYPDEPMIITNDINKSLGLKAEYERDLRFHQANGLTFPSVELELEESFAAWRAQIGSLDE